MDLSAQDFEFDAVMSIMKDELKSKAAMTATTLLPVSLAIHKVSGNLANLREINARTAGLLDELVSNRGNLEKCNQFCQGNTYSLKLYDSTAMEQCQITNEKEFEQVVQTLRTNMEQVQTKIDQIQLQIDGVGIFFILLNTCMLIENVHFYSSSEDLIRGHKRSLEDLKARAEKLSAWYEASSKSSEETNHFRSGLHSYTLELAIIETKLESLRSESVGKGITHLVTGMYILIIFVLNHQV